MTCQREQCYRERQALEQQLTELRTAYDSIVEENKLLCAKVEFQKAAWTQEHNQLTLEQLRLQWIARQGDEYSQGVLQDQPGDGDYCVHGMNSSGQGKTFLEALDLAMEGEK